MNEQENTQIIQPEVDEVSVEVVDQIASSDEELDAYTKGVSKRINKAAALQKTSTKKSTQG